MTDVVNHPAHYAEGWSNGAEVIDITENLSFNRGNAVKYIARAGVKDPEKLLEDLQKAQWYLNREIARVEFADFPQRILLGTAPEPRVWKSMDHIPVRVTVLDKDGTSWDAEEISKHVLDRDGTVAYADRWAPFTEVLEGTA